MTDTKTGLASGLGHRVAAGQSLLHEVAVDVVRRLERAGEESVIAVAGPRGSAEWS
ncbi:hypothetical protein [Streptomyces massasporeus]|uniref:hypothetical protein n=1 Tax=Streptomyces massasporeus TaxID=67324 RepID=UPI00167BE3AD|nr:hypothetical protein [Streptomyces massasporeus]